MEYIFLLRKITKRMYPYRGLSRVADLVRQVFSRRHRRYLVNDFDGDLAFYCALDEHISSQVFWRGSYSTDQLPVLRELLKPGMVFLDAGANKGEFTVFAAKYTKGGKVLAFEPVERNIEDLKANVAANGFKHVQLIRKGLGKKSGERMIYNMDGASGGEWNEGTFTLYPRPGLDSQYSSIPIVALDDFVRDEGIDRIDVMKIDIEGGELEMLEGAKEAIRRWKPAILIEVNSVTSRAAGYDQGEIIRLLEGWGYRCARIGRKGKTSPVGEKELRDFQNLLCVHGGGPGVQGDGEGIP